METAESKYQKNNMNRDDILRILKEKGCRITKQRRILLEVILEERGSSCKEIYYKAVKKDPKIGMATIYRMMNLLEEIGAIKWRNQYILCDTQKEPLERCTVKLEDGSQIELNSIRLYEIMEKGMENCGYHGGKKIVQLLLREEKERE